MKCATLISPLVPTISLQDTGDKALHLMEEYHLAQLPVVVEDRCVGLISDHDILDWEDTAVQFLNYSGAYVQASASQEAHVYEAVKLTQQFELVVLPVHDEHNKYLGSITSEKILNYLSVGTQALEQGGIVVLEMQQTNYSLTEIARICESEQVSILSMQVHNVPDTDLIHVTIKTNKVSLSAVVATFERMNYNIVELFAVASGEENLKDNYDALMHYLSL
jgi:acetoin utilization protein AcuB